MASKRDSVVLESVREAMDNAVNGTVFGTPINHDGVTVLPAAKVSGGGGGGGGGAGLGSGDAEHDVGGGSGSGGGLGMTARPLGVFVIKDGTVQWRPALDLNKVIIGAQIVATVALLTIRTIVKTRRRRLRRYRAHRR
jgi:uncharacterized spore protein YtfJ